MEGSQESSSLTWASKGVFWAEKEPGCIWRGARVLNGTRVPESTGDGWRDGCQGHRCGYRMGQPHSFYLHEPACHVGQYGKMKALSHGAWRWSVNEWPAAELQETSSRQHLEGAQRGCQEQELHLWCRHNLVDYGHHSF